jgi:hypothetical protein
MPAETKLRELEDRKRRLIAQAELNRSVVSLECAGMRARLSWLEDVRDKLSARRPWLVAGGIAAGLLARRRWRLARWAPAALAAWRWWQRLKPR